MSMPQLETYIEMFGDKHSTYIGYYRTYLTVTDYVAAKIAEAAYLGTEVEEKYREVLAKREEARQKLNELENAMEEENI